MQVANAQSRGVRGRVHGIEQAWLRRGRKRLQLFPLPQHASKPLLWLGWHTAVLRPTAENSGRQYPSVTAAAASRRPTQLQRC